MPSVIVALSSFASDSAYAGACCSTDQGALKATAKGGSQDSAARASNQSRFSWTDATAAVVMMTTFVVAGVTVIISPPNAVVHAAVIVSIPAPLCFPLRRSGHDGNQHQSGGY
jgi:hypothetical protein